jgi:tetratricopeptide (TPR) repeat protein
MDGTTVLFGSARAGGALYSQEAGDTEGKQGRITSADQFMSEALHFFGDETRGIGLSAWERGRKLADLVRTKRTLLVLDGMEPLQSTYTAVQRGEITDPGLTTLLEELARHNSGLCIVTTREPIASLTDLEFEDRVAHIELDYVTPLAGRALLRERRVEGKDDQLEATIKAFGGHAYALQLLGRYLEFFGRSEIAAAGDIPAGAEFPEESRHPRRVMAAYAGRFGEGSAEVELLHVLGLFDRPAERGAIAALRAEPIADLTERLAALDEGAWQGLLQRLRASGLVAPASGHAPDELDAHPLVREHFGAELRAKHLEAWRAGHSRLYEYFEALPEKHQPDTLEELAPLFQAVFHGCQAGRHLEALLQIYWGRIVRNREAYLVKKLGAFGADLAALAGFFDPPWERAVVSISEEAQAFVVGQAGYRLRALGRLREAVAPMQVSLDMAVEQKDWHNAAIAAGNLGELQLTLGKVAEAITLAERSVEYADCSCDVSYRGAMRATLAAARHQAGERTQAEALYQEAERLQAEDTPYCDLLLDLGRDAEVPGRANDSIQIVRRNNWLLDIALDHLSLGRAAVLAYEADGSGDLAEAERQLNLAVDGLRASGNMDDLPRGLLARAAYFRLTAVPDRFARAQRDLDEAIRIAARSAMRLHECDARLEYARLELAQGKREAARSHLARAEELVAATGYHRRDREVEKLTAALG